VSGTDNEFVISTGRDLQRMVWDGVSSSPTSLTNIVSIDPTNPNIRFNDGKCDQWGRLWAGAMSLPGGVMFRL
jgi:sugar lactone lactonase YvrE